MKLNYNFLTSVSFTGAVSNHSFLLRVMPAENDYQTFSLRECRVVPDCRLARACDNFGNILLNGFIAEPHCSFVYESFGEADLADSYVLREPLNNIYRYPTRLTAMDGELSAMLRETCTEGSVGERVMRLSQEVHRCLEYTPAATGVNTTAAEALALGKGVCQDYSHILLALCRACGIAARYVAGFYEGEQYTHAWVEYFDGAVWRAIDPTNDRAIESGYIKLAHGRDYDDCSPERGVFNGIVGQRLDVLLSVTFP